MLKLVHTWTGIIAGVFLSVLALTGSLIVFRGDFERAALPQSDQAKRAGRRVGLDQAAQEVARFRPGAHIRRVRLSAATGDPYIFQVESAGTGTERVVVDASSGRVLGLLRPGAVDWLVDLHRNFLSGKQGRKAVGVAGIVLFLLSATGMLMWLTGPRNWRAWTSLRKSGSTLRFNFELHRVAGLWAYGFLAVISFTGVELAYPDSFRQVVRALTGESANVRRPKKIGAASMRSLDEYLKAGRAAMPDGLPVELRLPQSGKGPVDLRLYRAGDFSPSGNHVYLDPATRSIIQIDRIVDRPIGVRFLAALAPIHYGQFGGIPIRIGWALLGLTPVLLFVTGAIVWWGPAKRTPGLQANKETGSKDFALTGR